MKIQWWNMENDAYTEGTNWNFDECSMARYVCCYQLTWIGMDMPNTLKISTEYSRNMIYTRTHVKYNNYFFRMLKN